jgi:hypothetical protein
MTDFSTTVSLASHEDSMTAAAAESYPDDLARFGASLWRFRRRQSEESKRNMFQEWTKVESSRPGLSQAIGRSLESEVSGPLLINANPSWKTYVLPSADAFPAYYVQRWKYLASTAEHLLTNTAPGLPLHNKLHEQFLKALVDFNSIAKELPWYLEQEAPGPDWRTKVRDALRLVDEIHGWWASTGQDVYEYRREWMDMRNYLMAVHPKQDSAPAPSQTESHLETSYIETEEDRQAHATDRVPYNSKIGGKSTKEPKPKDGKYKGKCDIM